MGDVIARKCPRCGAMLPASGGARTLRCEYCDLEVDLAPAAPVAWQSVPEPMGFRGLDEPPRVGPRGSGSRAGCALAGVLCALAGAGGAAYLIVGTGGALGGAPTARYTWHSTVALAQANGDDIEDPVLLVRTVREGDQLWLVTLDGTNVDELWRAGPFGSYSQGYPFTRAAVLGNRVLVTDFRAQAHLYDLASGARVASFPLPDRATSCCVAQGGTQVWVQVDNGRNAVLDTATGALTPAAQPPWPCVPTAEPASHFRVPSQGSGADMLGFTVPGFSPVEVLTEGALRVAVGRRDAGVRVPMVVGLAPEGRAPAWSLVPLSVDESRYVEDAAHPTTWVLRGGRVFVAYSLDRDEGRLAAVDARTGTRLWETPLPKCCAHGVDVGAIHVGATRVLTEQFAQVEVLDVVTGRLAGRVSPW